MLIAVTPGAGINVYVTSSFTIDQVVHDLHNPLLIEVPPSPSPSRQGLSLPVGCSDPGSDLLTFNHLFQCGM